MTPDELVVTSGPLVAHAGWAYYFAPATQAKGEAELGFDSLLFYVLGRAGAMGDVDAAVAASALGYFKPSLIEEFWARGTALASPRAAGLAFWEAAAVHGRLTLADADGVEEFCSAAATVVDAADPTGLLIYAGMRGLPLAEDAPGRAMQYLTMLRELRFGVNLLAVRAVGLDAKTAHAISRPNDVGMFGWSAEEIPAATDERRAMYAAAEELTNTLMLPAIAALDAQGRAAFANGLETITAALNAAGHKPL